MKKKFWLSPAHVGKVCLLVFLLLFSRTVFPQTISGTVTATAGKPVRIAAMYVLATVHFILTHAAASFRFNASGGVLMSLLPIIGATVELERRALYPFRFLSRNLYNI